MSVGRRMHYVLWLYVCTSVSSNLLAQCLKTARENFIIFAAQVQFGTKMNCLDFEVKRSEVEVTAIV